MGLWAQMVDEGDRFVLDGFRLRLGSDEAAQKAFRDWLDRRDVDALAAKIRMLKGRRPRGNDGK
jgi:hypothetical protein